MYLGAVALPNIRLVMRPNNAARVTLVKCVVPFHHLKNFCAQHLGNLSQGCAVKWPRRLDVCAAGRESGKSLISARAAALARRKILSNTVATVGRPGNTRAGINAGIGVLGQQSKGKPSQWRGQELAVLVWWNVQTHALQVSIGSASPGVLPLARPVIGP